MTTMFSFKFMKKSKSVTDYSDGRITMRTPSPHPLRRRASSADTVSLDAYFQIQELRLQNELEMKKQQKNGTSNRTRKKSAGRKPSNETENDATLFEAVAHENVNIIKQVLSLETVDVNAYKEQGLTILHHACMVGNIEVIKLLLEAGANPSILNRHGVSPLRLAVICGNFEAAFCLIHEHGVSCDEIRDGFQEDSPLLLQFKKHSKYGKM